MDSNTQLIEIVDKACAEYEDGTLRQVRHLFPLIEIVDKACAEYEDGTLGISKCLELFFIHDLNLDPDDAYDKALDLGDKYCKLIGGL